jgi:tetratricopeptide (TPR) repeat protein
MTYSSRIPLSSPAAGIAPGAQVNLSAVLLFARQYVPSENAARRAIALAPDRPAGHYVLGWALLLQDRNDEALAEFEKESIGWQRMSGRALVFARAGKADLAQAEFASMRKEFGEAASYQYAQINAALGNRDEAFHWLANARRVHDPGLMGWVFPDPIMDSVRSDPRYEKLIRELGFAAKP